jgi:hypothetical protein
MALPAMRLGPKTLALRVYPYPDEPLHGYVARLARLYGAGSIGAFLADDLGGLLPAVQVFDGQAQGAIARLVDLPADVFAAATFVRTAPGAFALNGEALGAAHWSHKRLKLCPACLRADAALPGRPKFRAHLRSWWNLEAVRACPIHGTELIGADRGTGHQPDWRALDILSAIANTDASSFTVKPAHVNDLFLSRFILARLGFAPALKEPSLLASLPLAMALEAFECVGAVALDLQRQGAPATAEPPAPHVARRIGHRLLHRGPDALKRLLERRLASADLSEGLSTPRQAFGPLYDWVAAAMDDPAAAEILAILKAFGLAHLNVSETQKLFRGATGARQRFTLRQAAAQLPASPAKVKSIVARVDEVVPPDGRDSLHGGAVIGPRTFAQVKYFLRQELTPAEAAEWLQVTPEELRELVREKYIRPAIVKGKRTYSRAHLEAQLAKLHPGSAKMHYAAAADEVLLTKAALLVPPARLKDVFRRLQQGALKARARLRDTQGLPGIVLGVADVVKVLGVHSRPPAKHDKIIGKPALAQRLNCTPAVVDCLIAAGAIVYKLPTLRKNGGWRVPVFASAQVADFERQFISLREIDCRLPIERSQILAELQAARVKGLGALNQEPMFFPRAAAEAAMGLLIGPIRPPPPPVSPTLRAATGDRGFCDQKLFDFMS